MAPPYVCLVTVHGIGFQQPPDTGTDPPTPGYADELHERLTRGDVVLLDVRPEPEYRAGHIAGARSAPLETLEALKLPKRRAIVAYCRGPYCVYADDAVRLLRERGLKAQRLDVGYPEWQRAGLPVEVAS